MRYLLLIILLFGLLIFAYQSKTHIPDNFYVSSSDNIFSNNSEKITGISEVCVKINEKMDKIKNIHCKRMPIIYSKNARLNLNGEMGYEYGNFRLRINHFLSGKEMDMGSNQEVFWFWSKRAKPAALYYSYHKDINKTFLKTVLSPEWVIKSLYVNKINTEDAEFIKKNDNCFFIRKKIRDHNDQEFIYVVLIDKNKEIILGKYLYNLEGKLSASTEYSNFKNGNPNLMTINWHEENIKISFDLRHAEYNVQIDKSLWDPPNIKNKINLAK
jgi:hypothetical protein